MRCLFAKCLDNRPAVLAMHEPIGARETMTSVEIPDGWSNTSNTVSLYRGPSVQNATTCLACCSGGHSRREEGRKISGLSR